MATTLNLLFEVWSNALLIADFPLGRLLVQQKFR